MNNSITNFIYCFILTHCYIYSPHLINNTPSISSDCNRGYLIGCYNSSLKIVINPRRKNADQLKESRNCDQQNLNITARLMFVSGIPELSRKLSYRYYIYYKWTTEICLPDHRIYIEWRKLLQALSGRANASEIWTSKQVHLVCLPLVELADSKWVSCHS